MLDLLNLNDLVGIKMMSYEKSSRVTRESEGHMAVLLHRLPCRALLKMEYDKEDEVDLDSPIWKQKRIKDRALAFLSDIGYGEIKNKPIRIALDLLQTDGFLSVGTKGNLFDRLVKEGYAKNSSKCESSQVITMFRLLRMIVPKKNKYYSMPNRSSLILTHAQNCLKQK
jgi:hypothetical protein